jgi:N-acetylmuramoyl-L-alanine amidase
MAAFNVLLCVAHTSDAPGATTPAGVTEHVFSTRACSVAATLLEAHDVKVKVVKGARSVKIAAANKKGARWDCLVEPHFNASESGMTRGYQTIFAAGSFKGKLLARSLARAMETGFRAIGYREARWIGPTEVPGPYVRHDDLPLITKTTPPACITEYAFATWPRDAVWIDKPDGADDYGKMVAAGILNYLVPIVGTNRS